MRTYDISLTISSDLPTWPGDSDLKMERIRKIEEGANANVTHLSMSVHTGTHVDAPYHFINNGLTVDRLPFTHLIGKVYVSHLPDVDLITAEVLANTTLPTRTRRVIFKTRNSQVWSNPEKGFITDFVGISPDGADFLVKRGVRLVGIDYLSIAPYKESRPTHEIFLNAGVVILEGLNLAEVSQGRYTLFCLPLKLAGADGSPARVILIGV